MNLVRRSYKKELLDYDNVPFEDIKRNMQELEFINRWLGGHRITLRGLRQLITAGKQISICEIGCGGGDNLAVIINWCIKNGITAAGIGIDKKKECIEFAQQNKKLQNCTQWIAKDYREVFFETKPDIIFSSLFCHHFTEPELVAQIRWMKTNSIAGFFINDLQRNRIAYHSISILTKIFSASYLVKNDAPLSVARGFKKIEWKDILNKAGISNYTIQWQWAFRHLIISHE